jgi:hypothetical protein
MDVNIGLVIKHEGDVPDINTQLGSKRPIAPKLCSIRFQVRLNGRELFANSLNKNENLGRALVAINFCFEQHFGIEDDAQKLICERSGLVGWQRSKYFNIVG